MSLPDELRFKILRIYGKGHFAGRLLAINMLLLFAFFSLGLYYLSQAKNVSAQAVPRPRPTPYPCDEVSPNLPFRLDDEFHSLRPYQASPCNPNIEETALFCGNDIILGDSITVHKSDAVQCYSGELPPGGGPPTTETCIFEVDRARNFAIDVSQAELPIMGYTEPSAGLQSRPDRVVNSVDQNETMPNAQKINEYVSWYLNGINERAEYPFLEYVEPDDNSDEAKIKRKEIANKIIDFSGPIKKLLAQSSQWRARLDQVDNAVASVENDAGIRHDQVAGCTYSLPIRFGPFKVAGVGNIVGPCYHSGILDFLATITQVRELRRLSDWDPGSRRPPLEEDYPTFLDYLIAVRRWRGQSCAVFEVPTNIPIIGGQKYFFCYDNPLVVNFWSNLFSYIPFSSTEDRKGDVEVETASLRSISPDVTLSNISVISEPADLFFAHMQEDTELADTLQGTFVPKNEARVGQIKDVSPSDYPFCDITQVRSNPGDQLFAGEIGVDLSYTATFECEFPIYESSGLCGPYVDGECVTDEWSCDFVYDEIYNDCGAGRICGIGCSPPNPSCTKNFQLSLGLLTKTPLADEAWARLVAGTSSVFKRIFPKIGENSPLVSILDIPAATQVNYTGAGLISAGNPGTLRDAQSAELYFPHIGGIHEYFLQCIQTALRPKGYGEVCESGALPGIAPPTDACPVVPDSAIPGKWLGGFKQNFISLADRWTADCPGPENNFAEECYNYVVDQSLSAGVNPAFSLTIWANESGASNYCHGGPTTQDMGINDPSIYQNLVEQIARFLALPFSGTYIGCRSQPGWLEPMHAFLSRFQAGGCNPNSSSGTNYYNQIRTFSWPLVSGGCTSGNRFSINWPTDNSCP